MSSFSEPFDIPELRISPWFYVGIALVIISCTYFFIGCSPKPQPQSTAGAIPAGIKSYEVSFADTENIPDQIILRPGQSAVLLKDIVVVARVPAQGNELYAGKVILKEGTVVSAPIVED